MDRTATCERMFERKNMPQEGNTMVLLITVVFYHSQPYYQVSLIGVINILRYGKLTMEIRRFKRWLDESTDIGDSLEVGWLSVG